jgi:hypothetical protein
MSNQPQGHPECYARKIGGCVGPVNREHYVSQGILKFVELGSGKASNYVRVVGLGFQPPNVVQQVGVASLTAKTLCERHHGLLSPYDSAGQAMFFAMEALDAAARDPLAEQRTFQVNGDALERWMLKTVVGGFYSGNFLISPEVTMRSVCPPLDWLEILFNRRTSHRGEVCIRCHPSRVRLSLPTRRLSESHRY